jgi:hypothetical protein
VLAIYSKNPNYNLFEPLYLHNQLHMFPIVGFLAHQMLGIVRFEIEEKRISFLVNILANLSYYL